MTKVVYTLIIDFDEAKDNIYNILNDIILLTCGKNNKLNRKIEIGPIKEIYIID